MTNPQRDNVLIVHWHDLGRYLGAYGHADVSSPRLDRLAAEGILFTRAHATAPLCSPSRGSLFTGRYPQSNGLVGLAHHGWEYRAGVRTTAAAAVRIWLAHSAVRNAARDVVPGAARVRRVRRVQLVLRVRRRARHRMAAGRAAAALPAHRRILRNPPALPAGTLRTGRSRRGPPARLPARPARRARGPCRLLRLDLGGRRRGRRSCSTPLPRPGWTAPPGSCSSPTTARRCRGPSPRCTTRARASR